MSFASEKKCRALITDRHLRTLAAILVWTYAYFVVAGLRVGVPPRSDPTLESQATGSANFMRSVKATFFGLLFLRLTDAFTIIDAFSLADR